MKFLDSKTIVMEREMSELDEFVVAFIRILEKNARYVIISGYVSILFGRARSTEDVDVLIQPIQEPVWELLYKDILAGGFWCLNSEDSHTIFSYLRDGAAVRFAKKDQAIPNIEVKYSKPQLDQDLFSEKIRVITPLGDLLVSSLERQIAFKRYYLASDKDIEDALYIEKLFNEHINKDRILHYKHIIEREAHEA